MAQWGPDAMQPCELSRVNQMGGLFVNGCPLPDAKRRKIVELALRGLRAADISRHLKVSSGCVSKILTRYYEMGVVQPKTAGGSRPRIATSQLVARIAQLKQEQPSLFAREVRDKLGTEGVCAVDRMPSVSSINRILRRLETPNGLLFWGNPPQAGLSLTGERKRMGSGEVPIPLPSSQETEGAAGLPRTRGRTVFSKEQLEALETAFQRCQYPEAATWAELARRTGLPEATIRVWFSNRRARWRREAMQAGDPSSGLAPTIPGAVYEWWLPIEPAAFLQPSVAWKDAAATSQKTGRATDPGSPPPRLSGAPATLRRLRPGTTRRGSGFGDVGASKLSQSERKALPERPRRQPPARPLPGGAREPPYLPGSRIRPHSAGLGQRSPERAAQTAQPSDSPELAAKAEPGSRGSFSIALGPQGRN